VALATVVNVADQGYPFADAICDVVFREVFGIRKPPTPTINSVDPVKLNLHPYAGCFEAFGMRLQTSIVDGKLLLNSCTKIAGENSVVDCELIPIGEGRFLPRDFRISANRNWDIAFWGEARDGMATHMLQGVFPLRRTN